MQLGQQRERSILTRKGGVVKTIKLDTIKDDGQREAALLSCRRIGNCVRHMEEQEALWEGAKARRKRDLEEYAGDLAVAVGVDLPPEEIVKNLDIEKRTLKIE